VLKDDPRARPDMSRQEIVDRLGWFSELGVAVLGKSIWF
jgi:hypothetical protein